MTRGPSPEGDLAVVVVNYGSHRLLEQNLGSVDLTALPVRVVVVDNWSTEAERAAITALCAARGWTLVGLPDNRGFGAAVNVGVRAGRDAGAICFLLLNPDAVVRADVVAELRRDSLARPMALISPTVLSSAGAVFFDGGLLLLDSGRTRTRRRDVPGARTEEWMSGACLVVHTELLDRIGGFAEEYFLYWEDVDLSHRCLAAGGELVVRRDLVAVHDAGGTQGVQRGTAKSALYYRYNCRNRLLFAAAHLPRRQLLRWIWSTPAVTREVLLRGGRRQLLTQPALMLAAVAGSLAGLRVAAAALLRGPAARARSRAGSVLVAHPGAELYGSDRMLLESVRGFVQAGLETVVALPEPGPLVAELERGGAQVVFCRMPVLRKSVLRPRGMAEFLRDLVLGAGPAWRLLSRAGQDGVYVSTLTIPFWQLLARLRGRQVTVHVHEAEQNAPRPARVLLAAPVGWAQRVVVNSAYSRAVLAAAAPRTGARAVVVYNGVAGPAGRTPPRPALEGPVRLAYVGRLSPRKGPQVAVAVLAELTARGVDAHLDLAGSVFPGYEWFEAELRASVAAADLTDRVAFLGFVPDPYSVLAAADVVLIPSVLDEPFGNTAVEAVLAARPLVVSATSGLREAAGGYPSVHAVPPEDVPAWAAAVQGVVAHWARTSRQAVADAEEAERRHAPARYRGRIAELVTSLVEPDGAGAPQP